MPPTLAARQMLNSQEFGRPYETNWGRFRRARFAFGG
jgi:hypothetical protein